MAAKIYQFRDAHSKALLDELQVNAERSYPSITLRSPYDPKLSVQVSISGRHNAFFSVDQLNHRGWTNLQEAQSIYICLRMLGARNIQKIWFLNPTTVREFSSFAVKDENQHLRKILSLTAIFWSTDIDGAFWEDEIRLGANFLSQ